MIKDPIKRRKYWREWARKHRFGPQAKAWRDAHREQINRWAKRYRKKHPEKTRQYLKKYRTGNAKYILQHKLRQRKYYHKHKEKFREKFREQHRIYSMRNRHRYTGYECKRLTTRRRRYWTRKYPDLPGEVIESLLLFNQLKQEIYKKWKQQKLSA